MFLILASSLSHGRGRLKGFFFFFWVSFSSYPCWSKQERHLVSAPASCQEPTQIPVGLAVRKNDTIYKPVMLRLLQTALKMISKGVWGGLVVRKWPKGWCREGGGKGVCFPFIWLQCSCFSCQNSMRVNNTRHSLDFLRWRHAGSWLWKWYLCLVAHMSLFFSFAVPPCLLFVFLRFALNTQSQHLKCQTHKQSHTQKFLVQQWERWLVLNKMRDLDSIQEAFKEYLFMHWYSYKPSGLLTWRIRSKYQTYLRLYS